MELSVSRASLLDALQRCQSVVERRHTVPILSNIMIEGTQDKVVLTASDMEVGIRTFFKADVISSGATTVSSRKLIDLVKELQADATIQLILDGEHLLLRSGNSKMRLATRAAEEFPALPEVENGVKIQMAGTDIAAMIASTSYAMSTDDTRKYLTGELFSIQSSGEFRLVATDGHRLAITITHLSQAPSETLNVIVPKKAMQEIRKMTEEEENQVHIQLNERQISVQTESHILTSKLIDARFPEYEEVIPKNHPNMITFDKQGVDQILRRAMVVANEFSHDVKMTLSEGQMTIRAHNAEQEELEESIAIDYDGDELDIGFNAKYLRDAMGVVHSGEIVFQFKDSLSPVLVLDGDDAGMQNVVMPLRI